MVSQLCNLVISTFANSLALGLMSIHVAFLRKAFGTFPTYMLASVALALSLQMLLQSIVVLETTAAFDTSHSHAADTFCIPFIFMYISCMTSTNARISGRIIVSSQPELANIILTKSSFLGS